MSEILYEGHGVALSEYTGPEPGWTIAELPVTADRRRYQITDLITGRLVTLSREQWAAMGDWFATDDDGTSCRCTCSNCSGCLGIT
jgi:hypothetical protein